MYRVSEEPGSILLVQEEGPPRRALCASLAIRGYRVIALEGEAQALRAQRDECPDLVILDCDLLATAGLPLVRSLRECSAVPIVVMSSDDNEDQLVAAFDGGADEYIAKPYRERELHARIRACLRSFSRKGGARSLELGAVRIDPTLRYASVHDRQIALSDTEYRLLAALVRAGGRVVTHTQLVKGVWGEGNAANISSLRVYIRALRLKIESDPAFPRHLLTEAGVGYRLSADVVEQFACSAG